MTRKHHPGATKNRRIAPSKESLRAFVSSSPGRSRRTNHNEPHSRVTLNHPAAPYEAAKARGFQKRDSWPSCNFVASWFPCGFVVRVPSRFSWVCRAPGNRTPTRGREGSKISQKKRLRGFVNFVASWFSCGFVVLVGLRRAWCQVTDGNSQARRLEDAPSWFRGTLASWCWRGAGS